MKVPEYLRFDNKLCDYKLKRLSDRIEFKPLNNYLVFSDPRGGSTWVTELVKSITSCPIIWEPLFIRKVFEFKKLGFSWRQFIPENQAWPEAYKEFDKLFKGKILNHWTASNSNITELKSSDQLLIKFCRGNQLLPWLTNHFHFKFKPIYVIRHPFAVVASQLKQGGWDYKFERFHIPQGPNNEIYQEHKEFLSSIKSKEEALTATWCLCNSVPLRHKMNNNNWPTLNYEEIVLNPQKSMDRILTEWGLKADTKMLNFEKPSRTALAGSSALGKDKIESWLKVFDARQIKKMVMVLDYFSIEEYTSNPYPEIVYNYKEQNKF